MSNFDLNDYIKGDNSLDYQKLYKSMENITGFESQKRREQHYDYVVGLFKSRNNGEILHNAETDVNDGKVPF